MGDLRGGADKDARVESRICNAALGKHRSELPKCRGPCSCRRKAESGSPHAIALVRTRVSRAAKAAGFPVARRPSGALHRE